MSMLAQAARGIKNIWSHGDDDYENDEDDLGGEDEISAAPSSSSTSKYSDHKFTDKYQSSTSTPSYGSGSTPPARARNLRSVPIPLRAREKNIYTLRPKTQDEAAIAADYLKSGSAVVVNLESVEREISVRIIDFMSGVCYGLEGQGHAMKLGDAIFLFTPAEFEISSDELDYGENREFFFKDVDGTEMNQPASAPRMQQVPAQPASTPAATASDAYTSSFANSYNSPPQRLSSPGTSGGMSGGGMSTPTASASAAPVASVSQSSPRAQTLPASSVYGSSGQPHVTIAGKPAPTSSLSPAPRSTSSAPRAVSSSISSSSRSWER